MSVLLHMQQNNSSGLNKDLLNALQTMLAEVSKILKSKDASISKASFKKLYHIFYQQYDVAYFTKDTTDLAIADVERLDIANKNKCKYELTIILHNSFLYLYNRSEVPASLNKIRDSSHFSYFDLVTTLKELPPDIICELPPGLLDKNESFFLKNIQAYKSLKQILFIIEEDLATSIMVLQWGRRRLIWALGIGLIILGIGYAFYLTPLLHYLVASQIGHMLFMALHWIEAAIFALGALIQWLLQSAIQLSDNLNQAPMRSLERSKSKPAAPVNLNSFFKMYDASLQKLFADSVTREESVLSLV
ncbi:MAG TPA: hypothetical protein VHD33_05775 [Legionellaceae bacterium]|nr:hypothetical protein [Legionellaceae bacterium]